MASASCDHEPSLKFTSGKEFVINYICPCAKCGKVLTFMPSGAPTLYVVGA